MKTEFFYNGSILAGQKCGNDTLIFMYDNNGDAFGFTYNGTEYYYVKNAQNDVTAITDNMGIVVAKYTYDAWGKVINSEDLNLLPNSILISEINPIRYRSYYFDAETNLYHLNTRYYSPIMCRFLNADGIVQTGQGMLDKNMFAYCENNPVNRIDPNGNAWVYNGITYSYDGSVSDFRRLEQGLPPAAYDAAVRTANDKNSNIFADSRTKNKSSRKDPKKGSENRKPSGDRERNIGHPNGEEHSRVAKGNKNVRRIVSAFTIVTVSVVIVVIVADDITGVGIGNDVLLAPTTVIWWDTAIRTFA